MLQPLLDWPLIAGAFNLVAPCIPAFLVLSVDGLHVFVPLLALSFVGPWLSTEP